MSLVRTYARPGVWLGFVASLLFLAGGIVRSWAPDAYRWFPPFHWLRHHLPEPAAVGLLILALLLSCVAFVMVRPRLDARGRMTDEPWRAPAVLALWALPLCVAPSLFSRDVYAYLDQGWLVAHGFDPYTTGMGTTGPLQDMVDPYWRGETVAYPPLALLIQAGVVSLGGGHIVRTFFGMRVVALLGLALVAWLLPSVVERLGGNRHRASWVMLLNPVTVIHLVGGAHNDAWMLAGVVGSLWLATRRWPRSWAFVLGAVAAGIATAIKQPALLAAVVVPLVVWPSRRWWRRAGRAALAVGIAGLVFAAISVATLGFGWLWASGGPMQAVTLAPACLLSLLLQLLTGLPWPRVMPMVLGPFLALLAAALFLIWWRRWRDPLAVLGWGYVAYLVLGPSLQPWYLCYALGFVLAGPLSRRWGIVGTGWLALCVLAPVLAEIWQVPLLLGALGALPLCLFAGWFAARYWRRLGVG